MSTFDFKGHVILIVDDDDDLRQVLVDFFEGTGAAVVPAANGQKAIDILKVNHVDAIISDVRMPLVDGLTLMKWVKTEKKGSVPFFLITAFTDLLEDGVKKADGVDVFHKPFHLSELEEALSKALQRERR